MSFHESISRSPDSGSVRFTPSQKTSMASCKTLPFTVTASFRTFTGFPINSVKETYICKKYYSVFSFIALIIRFHEKICQFRKTIITDQVLVQFAYQNSKVPFQRISHPDCLEYIALNLTSVIYSTLSFTHRSYICNDQEHEAVLPGTPGEFSVFYFGG